MRDLLMIANMGPKRAAGRLGYSPLVTASAEAIEKEFASEGYRLDEEQSDAVLRFLVNYRAGKGFDDAEEYAEHLLLDVLLAIIALDARLIPEPPNLKSLRLRLSEDLDSLRSSKGPVPPQPR